MASLADDAELWARLREAIDLGKGFVLLFVVVANIDAEALAVEGLLEIADDLGRNLISLDAQGTDDETPVRRLLTELGDRPLGVLRTHKALSRDREAFERCFVQLNARRDQIVAQFDAPLVVITRVDALRGLVQVAPDLFSVHAAQFHLHSTYDAGRPAWLLLPHEEFGLLGVGETFVGPPIDGMPSYLESIPEVPNPLIGRDEEVGRLRIAMARNPQRIRVWGARRVGKSTVIAAAIRDFEHHYERTLWFHGRAAHTRSAILGAIVRALDIHGRCPRDPVDIEARYCELTRVQRALIVVEWSGEPAADFTELPAPAPGSLLIEEASSASPSANATVEIGPLSANHAHTWEESINVLFDANLDYLTNWLCLSPAIPRRFLGEDQSQLASLGLLHSSDEALHFDGGDVVIDYSHRSHLFATLTKIGPPLTSLEREFEGRCLRLYTLELHAGNEKSGLDARTHWMLDWGAAPKTVAQRALESLPVEERAAFAAELAAEVRNPEETFTWLRQAIVAALASGQLARARRIFSNARGTSLRQELPPTWLADTGLVLALVPPAPLENAGIAKLLFEWESEFVTAHPDAAALARIRYGLSDQGEREPPAIRAFADALVYRPGIDLDAHAAEMTRRFDELAEQSAYPEQYDHFVHAHLCLLELRRGNWTEAKHHLDRVIATAHTWGLAYPLLRARLLTFEFALATGDLEPATVDLDATLARCDQLLGPLHGGTLAALTLALRIRDRLGQLDSARAIADDCRRRLRYAVTDAAIQSHLIAFFDEHGPAEVAASLRTRISRPQG